MWLLTPGGVSRGVELRYVTFKLNRLSYYVSYRVNVREYVNVLYLYLTVLVCNIKLLLTTSCG